MIQNQVRKLTHPLGQIGFKSCINSGGRPEFESEPHYLSAVWAN